MANLKKHLSIPNHAQKTASMLFDQQMWCWGCDVRRTSGNLLLLYGANKRPSPDPRYRSAYAIPLEGDAWLHLWGWGLWVACPQQGSFFIGRSRLAMCYLREAILMPDAWQKRDLPLKDWELGHDDCTNARHLLTTALHWIGTYETWLSAQVTPDYRDRVLAKWPERKRYKGGIPAAEMAERWFDLSTSMVN